jgi:hypothetical protein
MITRTPLSWLSPIVLSFLLSATSVGYSKEQGQEQFTIKSMSLSVKKEWLLGLTKGSESFQCKEDKTNYRTEECTATFERKECKDLKIPVFPYVMADCKSLYPSPDALPPALAQVATVGGNRVKIVRVSFFEGKAASLTIFHEGLNRHEFTEGLKARFGPPTSEISGSRDAYDDVLIWSRGDETLKAGPARLELSDASVANERKRRLAAGVDRANLDAMKREQEAKAKAKSDI